MSPSHQSCIPDLYCHFALLYNPKYLIHNVASLLLSETSRWCDMNIYILKRGSNYINLKGDKFSLFEWCIYERHLQWRTSSIAHLIETLCIEEESVLSLFMHVKISRSCKTLYVRLQYKNIWKWVCSRKRSRVVQVFRQKELISGKSHYATTWMLKSLIA